jgi:predicted ATP-dependent serine protease
MTRISSFRPVRFIKNRFGAVNEIGVSPDRKATKA